MTDSRVTAEPTPFNTAVLFLVFNRPDTTARVFEAIRRARPPRLYVGADGPRSNRPAEAERVAKVRAIVMAVDWPCEVKTLFRDENLGCKRAPSEAITWFFEHEEQGIILEDDCLPHPDYFGFCQALLDKYALDERIWAITGNNFQAGQKRGAAGYYFSKYYHCAGWAGWRRAWKHSDMSIAFWPKWRQSERWRALMPDAVERRYWSRIFDEVHSGKLDTVWDFSWTASIWYHGGLTAIPNVNLMSNIGYGADATHTIKAKDPMAALPTAPLGTLTHPSSIEPDLVADRYTFEHAFGGKDLRFPRLLLYTLPRRAAGRLYRRLIKRSN